MAKTRRMQIVISQIVSFLLNTVNLELWKDLKDLRSRVKRLWKNEYLQTIIWLVIVVIGIAGFQLGLRAILKTDYPLAVVETGSMVPKLNVGDIVVVQRVVASEIDIGDIIVFRNPAGQTRREYWFFTVPELIVHRVVYKVQDGGIWYFGTKGDANGDFQFWWEKRFPETFVEGRVVLIIPWLGHISLFMQSDWGIPTIICLIVALIVIEYLLPGKEKGGEPKKAKAL